MEIGAPGPGQPARRVRFFNDSKATSPDASITAVNAFQPGTALFIVGGYDKHVDMSELQNLLAQRAAGVIGIGQTGKDMVSAIQAAAAARQVELMTHYAGTLAAAVALAKQWARHNQAVTAVVLSPASASYDQFQNYEERGEHFTQLGMAAEF